MADVMTEQPTRLQSDPQTKTNAETLYELERGKPMPSYNHAFIQLNIGVALRARYGQKFSVASEASILLNDKQLTPDISVFAKRKMDLKNDVPKMTEVPLLTIEIASATQSQQALVDKCNDMLNGGVKACWLVQPAICAVTVLKKDANPKTFTDGIVTDGVTGIEVSVEDIFSSE
jgi:Uma2 family endonuclease